MTAKQPLRRYNTTSASWEGIASGSVSDGTTELNVSQLSLKSMYGQSLINGNLDIWQRGSSFSSPSNGSYTADRWRVNNSAGGGTLPSVAVSRQTLISGEIDGSFHYIRFNPNGSGTTGVSQYYFISQDIENGTRYLSGATGKKITISFYARSSISGKRIAVDYNQNYGSGGSPAAFDTANSGGSTITLTPTWTKYIVPINTVSISGKVFGTNNDDSLGINIWMMWGSSLSGRLNASTVETFGGSGTIDFAQLQVNVDDYVPFRPRSVSEELSLCQRYYEKSYNPETSPATALMSAGIESKVLPSDTIVDSQQFGKTSYSVKKRIVPTVTIYPFTNSANTGRVSSNLGTDLAANSGTVGYSGVSGFGLYNNSGSSLTTSRSTVIFHWSADAEY